MGRRNRSGNYHAPCPHGHCLERRVQSGRPARIASASQDGTIKIWGTRRRWNNHLKLRVYSILALNLRALLQCCTLLLSASPQASTHAYQYSGFQKTEILSQHPGVSRTCGCKYIRNLIRFFVNHRAWKSLRSHFNIIIFSFVREQSVGMKIKLTFAHEFLPCVSAGCYLKHFSSRSLQCSINSRT